MKRTDKIYDRYIGEEMCEGRTLSEVLELHEKWLKEEPGGVRAKLTGAKLTGVDLTGVDLKWAKLTRVDLTGVDLTGAILNEAILIGTKGIYNFGPIGREGRIGYAVKHENCIMIKLGCFWGDSDKAIKAIIKKYGEGVYADQVRLAVRVLEEQK